MFTPQTLSALVATTLLSQLTHALPQPSPGPVPPGPAPAPYPDSDLYLWSNDPACANTATKPDCTTAITQICANKDLTTNHDATVGQCTAVFIVDPGNRTPSPEICTQAYTQILDAGIGGALGYGADGNRTADPLYVVYPKSTGTGNCFKKAGDTSPVLAPDALPDGSTMGGCTATEKRALAIRDVATPADNGASTEGLEECLVEDQVWALSCSAVCLLTIAASSWSGPFSAVAGLTCFGGCEAIGYKLYRNCMTQKGSDPNLFGNKRGIDTLPISGNVCLNIQDQFKFQCKAQEASLLKFHQCEAPQFDGVQSSINT